MGGARNTPKMGVGDAGGTRGVSVLSVENIFVPSETLRVSLAAIAGGFVLLGCGRTHILLGDDAFLRLSWPPAAACSGMCRTVGVSQVGQRELSEGHPRPLGRGARPGPRHAKSGAFRSTGQEPATVGCRGSPRGGSRVSGQLEAPTTLTSTGVAAASGTTSHSANRSANGIARSASTRARTDFPRRSYEAASTPETVCAPGCAPKPGRHSPRQRKTPISRQTRNPLIRKHFHT